MNLDEAQREQVSKWISEGLKLSEIQNRIASELGVRLTYMEVRLLVDDLKLVPKDAEPTLSPTAPLASKESAPTMGEPIPAPETEAPAPVGTGGVSVSVDHLARPGSIVSGKVTFSDGVKAEWHLDQTGRIGLAAKPGYRPPASDVPQFQAALEAELARLGM